MSSLRAPYSGIEFSTPNVSITPTNWPRVHKTPITSYPPILSPVGPSFLSVNKDEHLVCFDSTYGKDDRVCGPAVAVPILPPKHQFLELVTLFLDAINITKHKEATFQNLTYAASLTTPSFRESWNGPQKISNMSNFQDYLFTSTSPFVHLTRVSQWRSEMFEMEPNFFRAKMQIETLDGERVSHRYVFEFERNTKFDTLTNTLPHLEWRISKIYPPLGNMDDLF